MPYDAMSAALAKPAAAPKRKPRGRPFAPGQSGNPSGKPCGTRNRVSLMLEALLEGEAQAIGRKLVELAKSGESRALKACIDRLMPQHVDQPIGVPVLEIRTVADLPRASAAVLSAVGEGRITPSQAVDISKLVDMHLRTVEAADSAARLLRAEAERRAMFGDRLR